jgi:hypothetical protein
MAAAVSSQDDSMPRMRALMEGAIIPHAGKAASKPGFFGRQNRFNLIDNPNNHFVSWCSPFRLPFLTSGGESLSH